jgi:hypothetical protein
MTNHSGYHSYGQEKPPPSGNFPIPTDDHDRKLLADIKEYGWHVIAVPEDEEGPAFAYSIGLLHSLQHPEIIVFGLEVHLMHRMINEIGEQIKSGEQFKHLDEAGDILDGYNVQFRSVEQKHYREYLGYARWFYQGGDFLVLQCVWPDRLHCYPWHKKFSRKLVSRQPVLGEDKTWPFHEGKNRASFTTRPVLEEGHPILLVSHDADGDWQFLCGTTNRTEDCKIVSLGAMYQRDSSIGEVADLPEGWRAERQDAQSPWRRSKKNKR